MREASVYGLADFSESQIDRYLERIGVGTFRHADAKTLEILHFAHIQHVVFESLDIHLGRPIEIDIPRIFDKVINRGRGGFCFELNTLFASLLHSLGYDVTLHGARVVTSEAKWIPFGHVCLNVECERRWLVDVEFGNSFQRPLKIGASGIQEDEGGAHLLEPVEEGWLLRSRTSGDTFESEYRFDMKPRRLDEFKERCHWTQTSLESGFTRAILATHPVPGGRDTIQGLTLKTLRAGTESQRALDTEERARILIEDFDLPEADVSALPPGRKADFFDHPPD